MKLEPRFQGKKLRLLGLGILLVGTVDVVYGMEQAPVEEPRGERKRARDDESKALKPLTIKQAKKRAEEKFAEMAEPVVVGEQLQKDKDAIKHYYTKEISDGVTGFDAELFPIVLAIKQFVASLPLLPCGKKHTLIWDIDETLLSNAELAFEENFETKRGTDSNYTFRVSQRCVGVRCVIKLVNDTKAICEHIFVTSRRGWLPGLTEATLTNLQREGVEVKPENLFLLEQKYAEGEGKITIAAWKRLVRDWLRTNGHVIVACIGDSEDDLAASDEVAWSVMKFDHPIKNFKFPNYLY